MLIRFPLSRVSPAGARGRLLVFIFHRVLESADPILPDEPDATRFEQIAGWIRSWFNVLPLDRGVDMLREGTLPTRAAAITFDDGYADNLTVALPILQRHGLPATVFVAPGFLNGGCMWNDMVIEAVRHCRMERLDLSAFGLGVHALSDLPERRQAVDSLLPLLKYRPIAERLALARTIIQAAGVELPRALMMTSAQVSEFHAAGMQIGAHTMTHPILSSLPEQEARREIADSRDWLEALIGSRVELFAYPNGGPGTDYRATDVDLVREIGFKAAFSTAWGAARAGDDLYQLPRFTPWDRARHRFGLRLLQNYRRQYSTA